MKKIYWIFGIMVLLIIGWFFVRFIIGEDEDRWIKDEKGVWIKHGNPSEIPDYVLEQQQAINCALNLYEKETKENLSSQCLGTCGNYAVDIVHVPRISEDNLIENQCLDYKEGKVSYFIELDKDRNIIRIM